MRTKIIHFIEEGLSHISKVGAVKEQLGCGFNTMIATANWILAILKVISKLVII